MKKQTGLSPACFFFWFISATLKLMLMQNMETRIVCETTKVVRVTYSAPARYCQRRLRVFPRTVRGSQEVLKLQWRCRPKPDYVDQVDDEFGNPILELRHTSIHREFHFELKLTTARSSHTCPQHTDFPPSGIGAFVTSSALCDRNSEIVVIAQAIKDVAGICEYVYDSLKYREGATHSGTTATQALRQGAGVCQDYAHLMIAICRAARLPARYVSGYNPAEGRMHAWVEVQEKNEWQAWDPTHNRQTRPDCVFVACGRDARDVQPLSGTYKGCARATLFTRCSTKVIEPSPLVVEIPPVQVELKR